MRLAVTLGGRLSPTEMVAHTLVVERPEGLLLVDTGFGRGDVEDPKRLGQPFRAMVRPALDPSETVHAQLLGLGLDPADVTDIALTHLDLDHAGGLSEERFAAMEAGVKVAAGTDMGGFVHGKNYREIEVLGHGDAEPSFSSLQVLGQRRDWTPGDRNVANRGLLVEFAAQLRLLRKIRQRFRSDHAAPLRLEAAGHDLEKSRFPRPVYAGQASLFAWPDE